MRYTVSQYKTMARTSVIVATAAVLSLFQNCSKTSFQASPEVQASLGGQGAHLPGSCYQQLASSTVPIKLLFVVDMSGSNYSNGSDPGTDPNKDMRRGSIQQFLDQYKSKTNFSWGFIGFQGTSAMSLIGTTSNPKFSSHPDDMQAAINTFNGLIDDNTTPYKAALTLAKTAINNTSDSSSTKYIVVFLSDGMPTDYANSSAGDAQINSDVQDLVNVHAGRVSFSTVYYGDADADNSGRLKNMAAAGGGQFLDTNANPTGKSFYISDVVAIPGQTCN